MKLNCGRPKYQRRGEAVKYLCNWHRWFAWFPVRVGTNDCRWLEYVERKAGCVHEGGLLYEYSPGDCIYREITDEVAE